MPNWPHLFTNLLYHLGLAVWIGGTIALGALVAPALFRVLPRPQAGAIFGQVLRRFARLRVAALVAAIAAAGVKHALWEGTATVWISLRWAALGVLAAAVVYEIAHLEPAIEARRARLGPDMGEEHPDRRAFHVLHKRAEGLMKATLLAALLAMLIS